MFCMIYYFYFNVFCSLAIANEPTGVVKWHAGSTCTRLSNALFRGLIPVGYVIRYGFPVQSRGFPPTIPRFPRTSQQPTSTIHMTSTSEPLTKTDTRCIICFFIDVKQIKFMMNLSSYRSIPTYAQVCNSEEGPNERPRGDRSL